MAEENQVEVSRTNFFDLPLYDVIVPLITRDLSDRDLLAMREAVAEFPAYRETIEEIIGAKRHLTVSVDSPDKEIFHIAVRNCRQLRSIEINFFNLWQHWNKYLVKLAKNPLISEFIIKRGTWEKIYSNTQISLRRITLDDVMVRDEVLSHFFAQQPFLRSIKLRFPKYTYSNTLLTIGRTCHQLEEIDMSSSCIIIYDADVRYIAENCPRLRTFLFDHFRFLSEETIDILLDRNIAFCQADDSILLGHMERRERRWRY